jgi:diguanylate cyclase (GGDEF)-like protein
MLMQWLRRLSIGTKLQGLVAIAFLVAIALLLGFQTFQRLQHIESERREANVRIVRGLSAPVAGGLVSPDSENIIYSFMDVLTQMPSAAGLVIVHEGTVVKTQQSLEHLDLDTDALASIALQAGKANEDRLVQADDFQLVAVPVIDTAGRTIGAFAIGWSTKGLLDMVWRDAAVEAGVLVLLPLLLLVAQAKAVRQLVLNPITEVAAALESTSRRDRANLTRLRRHCLDREDEIGTLARAVAAFREQALTLQDLNDRFDAALSNMPHGLVMFDGQRRLLLCNSQYTQMYDLPLELMRPGTPRRALVEYRASRNSLPTDGVESFLARTGKGGVGTDYHELTDGRVIAVSCQPLRDGGYVAAHEDVTDRKRAQQKIEYMARHDALTGLPNRVLLREELDKAREQTEKLAILGLDLDQFKRVNDTLGHAIGDSLLKEVAERLRVCLGSTDMAARLGGDEFAILQVGADQPQSATLLAERIIEMLELPFDIDGHHLVIGTSIGVAFSPEDGKATYELLKAADLAMYRAKQDGRGTYRFFEPEMDSKVQARRILEFDLRKALANGELQVHYQPLINIADKRVSGFEALLRWYHPERGLVPPGAFIPLAEDIGLIGRIGAWVLKQACADAMAWPDDLCVAVNVSPVQFKSRTLILDLAAALGSSGLAPHRLELEITESAILQDTEATFNTLHEIRDLGVRISMDDFGTGYSSLSNLGKFPFHKIKIDQSFIRDLRHQGEAAAIVTAVLGLGKSLGMVTTAEGVETDAQLKDLIAQGCTEAQGFLFSPAIPEKEIASLLLSLAAKSRSAA